MNIFLCQTNPADGQCISSIGPSVDHQINANDTDLWDLCPGQRQRAL